LGSENHNEKLVLYIPEKSLPTATSSRGLRRNVSLSGDPRPTSSTLTNSSPTSNSTEGFDRFASIRRSRRYKKESETPASSSGLTRSASLYSTVRSRSRPERENDKPAEETMAKPKLFADDNHNSRSSSARTISKPELRSSSSIADDLKSSRVTSHPVIMSSGGTSIVQIRSPNSSSSFSTKDTRGASKAVLSSSPGTAERDEGFEESHSSLSETNSQTESHNISAVISSKPPDKKSQKVLSTSFRLQSRPSLEDSPFNVNNNNNNTSNTNKTSSRGSLISSKTSLTSQTTVGTVRENDTKQNKSKPTHSSSMRTVDSKGSNSLFTSPSSAPICNNNGISSLNGDHNDSNKSSNSFIMQQNNSKNHLHSLPASVEKSSKSPSKGLTPRILSFMRPTASSTAKDKADFGKSKSKSSKQTFR